MIHEHQYISQIVSNTVLDRRTVLGPSTKILAQDHDNIQYGLY